MNNKLRILLLAIASPLVAIAQKEYPNCTYSYFKNKKVATSICFDENNRWGKARAYDRDGNVIYEQEVRRIAGTSRVIFSYYDDGSVQKAEWHSAPDGGIQWYNSTTYFSNDGTITKTTEHNYDDSPSAPSKNAPTTQYKNVQLPSKTIKCATIQTIEYWFTNNTTDSVYVTVISRSSNKPIKCIAIAKNTKVKGGDIAMAELFADLSAIYTFSATGTKNNNRHTGIKIIRSRTENVSKQIKRINYLIR